MRKGTLKNVLMISYYFPPSGGSGVQRVLKYVKYLPQMGFRPIVLTVKEGSFDIEDKSLFLDIQDNVKVYRVPIFEPRRIYAFFQKKSSRFDKINKTDTIVNNKNKPLGKVSEWIRSNLFVPDSRMLWIPAAIRLGKQIIEKENISCIFSSSPPFTCSVIGKKLKQATRLPWINDIRDPWTNHAPLVKRSCLPLLLDRYLERKSYEVCDVFHYAWKGIYDDIVKKYPHVNPNKSMWIPNGYDEDDFVTLPDSISKVKNSILTLCHTGLLTSANRPDTFFEALSELITENKIASDKIKIIFAGHSQGFIEQKIKKYNVESCVQNIGYLPHKESISIILSSDMGLVFAEYRCIPGKLFEYIGARVPIFAISNSCDVNDILDETGGGYYAEFNNKYEIKRILYYFYERFYSNDSLVPNELRLRENFSRFACTQKLANEFKRLT